MKICFLCVEIFAWGKYGGFGRATRIIGRELVKRGYDVYAIVPRRGEQKAYEELDGIRVYGFEPLKFWQAGTIAKKIQADVYHSEEPSFITYFVKKAVPEKRHIVTFRDPRDLYDWWLEFLEPSMNKAQVILNYLFENNSLVTKAVRRLDRHFAAANFLCEKAQKIYRLNSLPQFLPSPAPLYVEKEKAESPTVCFLARWDRRKRPEIFFRLTKKFPNVTFIAAGASRDKQYEAYLRAEYGKIKNLHMIGFIDQFNSNALGSLLGQSWILVNTASREGLPNSFIEALAFKCAILSAVDPDNFVSEFGYLVRGDNFAKGLEFLLKKERWRRCGQKGYEYTKKIFESNRVIDLHIKAYEDVLK